MPITFTAFEPETATQTKEIRMSITPKSVAFPALYEEYFVKYTTCAGKRHISDSTNNFETAWKMYLKTKDISNYFGGTVEFWAIHEHGYDIITTYTAH